MSRKARNLIVLLVLLAWSVPLRSQNSQPQERDRRFQSAVAQYESGHYAEAIPPLEKLLHEVPESFEVHELLGLTYAAQSQDTKANEHLAKAVRINPDSVAALSNLAASYARLGKFNLAIEQFTKAVELEPTNFDTNHNLGEAYIHAGNVGKAIPFLEKAQRINPGSYDNGYDLSLGYLVTGHLAEARSSVESLLKQKDTAELHNLLGQIEEKDGQFVAAATQFEAAAHMEPSESNLFDWAGQLALDGTLEPAGQGFLPVTAGFSTYRRV